METRSVQCFLTACNELNISRAARTCQVTQPTLTRTIQQLEDELGTQLFYRKSNGLQLTHAGQAFIDYAQKIISLNQAALLQIKKRNQSGKTTLSMSVDRDFIHPDMIKAFKVAYPQVTIIYSDLVGMESLTALHEGRLDLVVMDRNPAVGLEFEAATLFEVPLTLLYPRPASQEAVRSLSLGDYVNEEFIGFCEEEFEGRNDRTRSACLLAGFPARFTEVRARDYQGLIGLVAAGKGIALVPQNVCPPYHPEVQALQLKVPRLYVEVVVVWRKQPVSQILATFLQELLRDRRRWLQAGGCPDPSE